MVISVACGREKKRAVNIFASTCSGNWMELAIFVLLREVVFMEGYQTFIRGFNSLLQYKDLIGTK